MLEARLADSPVTGVLLDLAAGEEGHEGEMAFRMLERLKSGVGHTAVGEGQSGEELGLTRLPVADSRLPSIRVIVFGPHVQAADLAAAKKGGADVVMARGALAANLPRVLRELGGGSGGGLTDQLTD
jgi:hypothetical protein